jgi:hypothetical protein
MRLIQLVAINMGHIAQSTSESDLFFEMCSAVGAEDKLQYDELISEN